MTKDYIKSIFKDLSMSQGFYGRFLEYLDSTEGAWDKFIKYINENECKDLVDLIMLVECNGISI